MRNRTHWRLASVALLLALGGCSAGTKAPVVSREPKLTTSLSHLPARITEKGTPKPVPAFHTVSGGETLFAIAWRYGLDYREIARANRIKEPYVIYPSQRLALSPSTREPRRVLGRAEKPNVVLSPMPGPKIKGDTTEIPFPPTVPPTQRSAPWSQKPVRTAGRPQTPEKRVALVEPALRSQLKDGINWQWPARGKIETTSSLRSTKGVNILGREGQIVTAAAPGEIVYSGSGLSGYGKLIIVKHDENYLSAYAHNSKLLLKEGDRVGAGEPIAEMGSTGARQAMLHFEIRRSGKPVNPLDYLPKP